MTSCGLSLDGSNMRNEHDHCTQVRWVSQIYTMPKCNSSLPGLALPEAKLAKLGGGISLAGCGKTVISHSIIM